MHLIYEYVFTRYSVRAKKVQTSVLSMRLSPRRDVQNQSLIVTFVLFYIPNVPETGSAQNRMSWARPYTKVCMCVCVLHVCTGHCKVTDECVGNPFSGPECCRKLRHSHFATIDTRMWQGCQPYAPASFTSNKYFWWYTAAGRTMSMNNPTDTMEYWTRDLLTYSAVPQRTEPPRELQSCVVSMIYIYICICI